MIDRLIQGLFKYCVNMLNTRTRKMLVHAIVINCLYVNTANILQFHVTNLRRDIIIYQREISCIGARRNRPAFEVFHPTPNPFFEGNSRWLNKGMMIEAGNRIFEFSCNFSTSFAIISDKLTSSIRIMPNLDLTNPTTILSLENASLIFPSSWH